MDKPGDKDPDPGHSGGKPCPPGSCFRDEGCVVTMAGVQCAPCPDGYTGDGVSCDDVDEVMHSCGMYFSFLIIKSCLLFY